jgi:hypothetical protein
VDARGEVLHARPRLGNEAASLEFVRLQPSHAHNAWDATDENLKAEALAAARLAEGNTPHWMVARSSPDLSGKWAVG